jgi:murein DD-endopeptidase MepM/ murein hydrolase activator NlpD
MRRRLLTGAVLALLAWPATGHAQSGGAAPPAPTGGAGYGTPVPSLVASRFAVSPRTLQTGVPARFRYRIDGSRRSLRVRVDLLPAGSRRTAVRVRMGWKRPGRTLVRTWTPDERLTPGDYVARLHAVDRRGRTLRRTASASGRSRLTVVAPPPPAATPTTPPATPVGSGAFPVRGPYKYGDGFGADRGSYEHRGQDILAAEGTPVVSPRGGVVSWRAYQAEGAGHYVVIDADDGRDFVFMHLKDGTITVRKDDVVSAGQVFAQVGTTGRTSGAHLHFEIWPTGWYSSDDAQPIDPRPDLDAWASGV